MESDERMTRRSDPAGSGDRAPSEKRRRDGRGTGVLPARRDRIIIMGILNVTPDSFSDGGRWRTAGDAVAHGHAMRAMGADLVDVGGESTRPGAARIPAAEELRRVVPVVSSLATAGIGVSVDTTRASVADACLRAGAVAINDVSGGTADPGMAQVAANAGCPWILAHSRGTSQTMHALADYQDVVSDVVEGLARRADAALAAGVQADRIIVDPGLGFAKRPEHNWQLIAQVDRVAELGFPVLIGASRKSFLGRLLPDDHGIPRPVLGREDATVAVTTYVALAGAWGVRVHDVRASADAALAAAAIQGAGPGGPARFPAAPPPAAGMAVRKSAWARPRSMTLPT